jgi:cysteinyl-tRNA synthetase
MRRFSIAVLMLVAAAAVSGSFAEDGLQAFCRDSIRGQRINSWAYQLQRIDPERIARSSADLVVIDYSRDGTDANAFAPDTVAQMRLKPDGGRRLVLGYLSIGEAESYRFYWREDWEANPPPWLGPENPDWPRNYKVRYWDEDWHKIIFGAPSSYLDKIVAAGFDGIYLDLVDAFDFWEDRRPNAAAEMVQFIRRIADHARKTNPDFVVVSQNGEQLVEFPQYLNVIDAIAKEDLFYGIEGEGVANRPDQTANSLRLLRLAQKANRPVLAIEYVAGPESKTAAEKFRAAGVIGIVGGKALDTFAEPPRARASRPGSGWCDS